MEKLICASCNTTETTEYRKESNWDLCWTCHKSWLEHEEYLKELHNDAVIDNQYERSRDA